MDVRTALASMRAELKMRQTDFATAVGVSPVTVNRWETGKNPPNRAMSLAIIAYAETHGVSTVCQETLKTVLLPSAEQPGIDDLKYAKVDQINRLVNDSSNGVLVCDAVTYELLYVNRQTARFIDQPVECAAGKKCYEFLFNRDAPCADCPIVQGENEQFFTTEYESPETGRYYMVRSKMVPWEGRRAHIEYITDITEQQRVRRELEHSRELMSMACRDAGIWMFTLGLPDGTAYIEPVVQAALHMPAAVPDFFNAAVDDGLVCREYAAGLRSIVPRIMAGESPVTLEVGMNKPELRTKRVRLHVRIAERGRDGRATLAICYAQVIECEDMEFMATFGQAGKAYAEAQNDDT